MLVRLIYPEKWKITFRQILDYNDRIGDVIFTTEEVDEADLVVVVNFSPYDLKMKAGEIWLFHQEPADRKTFGHWVKSYKAYDRVFGPWADIKKSECANFYNTHGSVFWAVSGKYNDYLSSFENSKTTTISAITSSKTKFKGHKERLKFLYTLQERLKDTEFAFEIKGQGIDKIKTKDEVLIPSKYSLCIENTIQKNYITEKLNDAFLCGSMPIYIGAPNVLEYYPENSLIYLPDYDVDNAEKIIKNAIETGLYEKTKEERQRAKEFVLNKYNFFYNIVDKIKEFEIEKCPKKEIFVKKNNQMRHPLVSRLRKLLKR